jgi:hypothetical protein
MALKEEFRKPMDFAEAEALMLRWQDKLAPPVRSQVGAHYQRCISFELQKSSVERICCVWSACERGFLFARRGILKDFQRGPLTLEMLTPFFGELNAVRDFWTKLDQGRRSEYHSFIIGSFREWFHFILTCQRDLALNELKVFWERMWYQENQFSLKAHVNWLMQTFNLDTNDLGTCISRALGSEQSYSTRQFGLIVLVVHWLDANLEPGFVANFENTRKLALTHCTSSLTSRGVEPWEKELDFHLSQIILGLGKPAEFKDLVEPWRPNTDSLLALEMCTLAAVARCSTAPADTSAGNKAREYLMSFGTSRQRSAPLYIFCVGAGGRGVVPMPLWAYIVRQKEGIRHFPPKLYQGTPALPPSEGLEIEVGSNLRIPTTSQAAYLLFGQQSLQAIPEPELAKFHLRRAAPEDAQESSEGE